MQGKKYYINLEPDWTGSPGNISYYNKEGTVISKISTTASGTFLIPEGTVRMSYHQPMEFHDKIYEIRPYAETVISTEFTYPKLTEYGVEQAYNTATLTYFNTSVKRLYKINDGEWKEYKNPIKLQLGETIYAKGIDKNGIETKVTSYKSTIKKSDALGPEAYDGNESTYHRLAFKATVYLDVDESMQGKKYYINLVPGWTYSPGNISYYNKEGTVISKISTTASGTFF